MPSGPAPFQDRVVLVTGGSRGIGRALCEHFAEHGARVAFLYGSDDQAAEDARAALGDASAGVWRADVSDEEQAQAAVSEVASQNGRLDVLVNCAGINVDKTVQRMPAESWRRVIDVNLTGAFLCAKAAIGPMREAGYGRIINVSSVVGHTGGVGVANYAASKSGLFGLTRSLALEVARYGITANAVAPGYFEVGMITTIPEEYQDKIKAQIPVGRFGRSQEIAHAVGFLASDHAGYVTGATLDVNGGLRM